MGDTSLPTPPTPVDTGPFDEDGDGFPAAADCDDTDPEIHPGAGDAPYDGVDADCGFDDDYDVDADGHTAQAFGGGDCDDANPFRYFGAPRICGNDLDDDCDLEPDCDLRGELFMEDVGSASFTGPALSEAGYEVAVGDVDADGAADMIIMSGEVNSTWLFRGPLLDTRLADAADAEFPGGYGGATFGDFDGDGLDDVASTSMGFLQPTETYVYLAATGWNIPVASLLHESGQALGTDTTASADVNADGLDDLVIGGIDPCDVYNPFSNAGCVAIYHAPLIGDFDIASMDAILLGEDVGPGSPDPGVQLGGSADLTADGLPDLIVTDGGGSNGAFYVVETPLPPVLALADVPRRVEIVAPANQAKDAVSGDLDGDGYLDLLAAMLGQPGSQGAAWAFAGPITGPLGGADAFVSVADLSAYSIAMPGDLDGDGFADLIVHDLHNDTGNSTEAAKIFYAPRGAVVPDAIIQAASVNNGIRQLASPGDIDGDGLADFIAAGPGLEINGVAHGGATVFLGLPTGF